MNSDGIIKGFDIFENKAVSLSVVSNAESVKPFSFDEGVEGFYTGIVIRITGTAVA